MTSVVAASAPAQITTRERTKVALSCFLGSMIEWYDFMLYGFLAPLVFDKLFFPKIDPVMAIPGALIQPMHIGVTSSFYPELFRDTRVRFSGVSLGRQFGTIFGGGIMPVVAASLLAWSGGSLVSVLVYFSLVSLISIAAVLVAEETKSRAI